MVYHSKLMEEALYGIQRVGLAKRSTIELALTRMCEPRLSASYDALLARVARLEDELSRLRLGIPTTPNFQTEEVGNEETQAAANVLEKAPTQASAVKKMPKAEEDNYKSLSYWRELVETLGGRKPSIAGLLGKSKAYHSPTRGFLITFPSDFIVSIINKPETMLDIKSKISEYEDRNIMAEPFEVTSTAKTDTYHLIDELEAATQTE